MESDIIQLSFVFIKYVDLNLCCFIPGKVIDEIISVLRTIQMEENLPAAYEILEELRDLSSMAIEFFEQEGPAPEGHPEGQECRAAEEGEKREGDGGQSEQENLGDEKEV